MTYTVPKKRTRCKALETHRMCQRWGSQKEIPINKGVGDGIPSWKRGFGELSPSSNFFFKNFLPSINVTHTEARN